LKTFETAAAAILDIIENRKDRKKKFEQWRTKYSSLENNGKMTTDSNRTHTDLVNTRMMTEENRGAVALSLLLIA